MMFPPLVLTPMASHLGDFFLTAGKPAEAVESYQRALAAFPNDMNALLGLKNAFEKAGQPDKAATIDAQIESLRAQ